MKIYCENLMKDHPREWVRRWSFLSALAAAILLSGLTIASAEGLEYVQDDAEISGKEVHGFTESGQRVLIILGDFKLTLDGCTLTGRDAVVWVRDEGETGDNRHEIKVYVEGDKKQPARVIEPDGVETEDNAILVVLHVKGDIIAAGQTSDRSLDKFPLYKRGVEACEKTAEREKKPALKQAPLLVLMAKEDVPSTDAAGADSAVSAPKTPKTLKTPETRKAATTAPTTAPSNHVSYHADKLSGHVEEIPGKPGRDRRVIVLRGNVYLSQGVADSALFLELRSQVAVIFTEKRKPDEKKAIRSPLGAKFSGAKDSKLRGEEGEVETIVGVYLFGDVVIARGERYLRAPEAYYDFMTDRALIIKPVLRTIQKQRNIPIYIRAEEGRFLSAREMWFKNAKVTSSDFYSPSYHIGASRVYLMDKTPYDERTGKRLGEPSYQAKLTHTTFNVRGIPLMYWWRLKDDFTQGNTPLRKLQMGRHGDFGWGLETQWHLFRLMGIPKPHGVKAYLDLDVYEVGVLGGINVRYARQSRGRQYTGFAKFYGMWDRRMEDDFGEERENITAPETRGRILVRHKEFLPKDWQLQFELSYICDRNFLEKYAPSEFLAGKEQETLVYAKKQRDNWAFTTLFQVKTNRYLTQTDSYPDFGFHLIGEPLWGDRLTFYSESHAGIKNYRPDNALAGDDSGAFGRADTRAEIEMPMKPFGDRFPLRIVPYAVGRLTYWGDQPEDGASFRPYGQVGVKANMHIWKVYDQAKSRFWDVNRLKHIITPQVVAWISGSGGVQPDDVYPMNPDIEEHIHRIEGMSIGVHQRLQTKRGPAGAEETVDWMRLNVTLGAIDSSYTAYPADGRSYTYRPEHSVARSHLNTDYTWQISDSVVFMTDMNYDIDNNDFGRFNAGFAVSRDPRLRYYLGVRHITDLNSTVGTFGLNYKINGKYSISFWEQYDFDYEGGQNMGTSVTIIRKFPRWYGAFTFSYDTTNDELTLLLTFWPEGIPEVKIGGARMSLLGSSDSN